MTHVSKAEVDRFGDAAPAMIPMVIIWKGSNLPHVISTPYQQTDLLGSIKSVVSNQYWSSRYQGSLLITTPQPTGCVFYARGDNRDLVYVCCGGDVGVIKIDGDDTRLIRGKLSNEALVINMINYNRLIRNR